MICGSLCAYMHLYLSQYVTKQSDITFFIGYVFILTGRGVFALHKFCKGDFVAEYRGDCITEAEAERRKELYHPSCWGFLFYLKWRGKTWW